MPIHAPRRAHAKPVEGYGRTSALWRHGTGESAEYLSKREELRLAEIDLRSQRERVATLRRQLPPGAILEDYGFVEGPPSLEKGDEPTKKVRLSELFTAPDRALVIYQFMYGKKQTSPCPMCTAWIARSIDFSSIIELRRRRA